jgi:hypothetical protein
VRYWAFVCAIFLSAATSPMTQKPEKVAYFHLNRVKPGMVAQYETTRKQHWLWHKKLGDTWSYYVWQIVSGEATGAYVISSFGHTWKEVDESDQLVAGPEDPAGNVEPYLDSELECYFLYRSDLSLAPQEFSPTGKVAVTRVLLKPESVNDFVNGIRKVNAAIRKTGYPLGGATRWFELVSGGESPQFLQLSDRTNWAAFAQSTDKELEAMLEGTYGKKDGAAILRAVRSAIRSQHLEAWQYRPDLSFLPAPK